MPQTSYLRTALIRSMTWLAMTGAVLLLLSMATKTAIVQWPDAAKPIAYTSISLAILALTTTTVLIGRQLRNHWRAAKNQ